MSKRVWEKKQNKDALSLIKIILKKLTLGKIQVLHSGWYEQDGQYTFRIIWKDVTEK